MTIKVIAMLARKPGLSEQEFVGYYENRHAPLILSIAPQIRDYRRNYLQREGAILATGARPPASTWLPNCGSTTRRLSTPPWWRSPTP